jgi:hypothetical protein
MRRLFLSLIVLALTIPATAQMRGGGVRGSVRVAPSRGPLIRTVPNFNGIGFRGNNGFRGRNRFVLRGSNRFANRHRFGCGFNNNFAFNSIPNSFCGGFGFNSFGFNGGFGYGGYGLPLFYGDYDSSGNVAYSEHALHYDDSRDREMSELLLDLRDQQRELDYMINNMQRQQHQQNQSGQSGQQQSGPQPRGSMLRQQMNNNRPEREQPATALIFKDGRHVDVRNYVIAKGTLTILDGGIRQHVPLSQLDVPATQKANEDRGVSFKAPTTTVSLLCNPADPNLSCRPHQSMTEAQRTLTP